MPRSPRDRRRAPRGATIEDVAAAAGVSVATVSRALRDLPNVAPATAERVRTAARELHYRPDPGASSLAGGRTKLIGVAVPTVGQWYFGALVSAVEDCLRHAGYGVMLFTVADESALEVFLGAAGPFRKRVDGLILADLVLSHDELHHTHGLPESVVTLGQRSSAFSSVDLDDDAAVEAATAHLVALGHERIAVVRGPLGSGGRRRSGARLAGHHRALAAAGIAVDPCLELDGDDTAVGGAEAMRSLLALDRPPPAVVAFSDEMAAGALFAARSAGLDVPGDCSVIGFDDQPIAEAIGLTTIRQDVGEVGRVVAELVVRGLENPDEQPARHVIATTFVERDTVGRSPNP